MGSRTRHGAVFNTTRELRVQARQAYSARLLVGDFAVHMHNPPPARWSLYPNRAPVSRRPHRSARPDTALPAHGLCSLHSRPRHEQCGYRQSEPISSGCALPRNCQRIGTSQPYPLRCNVCDSSPTSTSTTRAMSSPLFAPHTAFDPLADLR